MFDIADNECPRGFERRRFQKGQISPLPCDEIEGSVETLDMVLRYRNNFDWVHRLGNMSIPPLAEWSGNNYLGSNPQTTD